MNTTYYPHQHGTRVQTAARVLARHVAEHSATAGRPCDNRCIENYLGSQYKPVRVEAEVLAIANGWVAEQVFTPTSAGAAAVGDRNGLVAGEHSPPVHQEGGTPRYEESGVPPCPSGASEIMNHLMHLGPQTFDQLVALRTLTAPGGYIERDLCTTIHDLTHLLCHRGIHYLDGEFHLGPRR